MVSNGESNIEKLVEAYKRGGVAPEQVLPSLIIVVQLQHQRIRQLEQEIFDRCMDLRQRVATIEQRPR